MHSDSWARWTWRAPIKRAPAFRPLARACLVWVLLVWDDEQFELWVRDEPIAAVRAVLSDAYPDSAEEVAALSSVDEAYAWLADKDVRLYVTPYPELSDAAAV